MSIILNYVRKCVPLRLLHQQYIRCKSKCYKEYLEKMNVMENDPFGIYVEILNRHWGSLRNNINEFDRMPYKDIYISDDIYQENKDKLSTNNEQETNQETNPGTNPDKSGNSNNTE